MEKLIFKNGHVFDAAPLGTIGNDITKRRRVTFASELGYAEVLAILSDQDNISQITYTLQNDIVIGIYTDCVSLKSLSVDMDNGTYTAEFSTDATEKKMQELQEKVAMLEFQNQEMQQTINVLVGGVEDAGPEPVE